MSGSSAVIGPVAPNRTHPLPLWAQINDDLRRRIELGEFEEHFPGELDLTEQYGVSRHTVREALRVLRTEGVLKSERGRGTSVQDRPYSQNLGTLYSLFATIEAQGVPQTSEVRRLRTTTNPTIASELGLADSTELVVLERVRFANYEPLAHDTSWLPAHLTREILEADFTQTSLYGELKRRCNIDMNSGREKIIAQGAPRHIAEALNITHGTAGFSLERLGTSNGQPLEWRETFIRGDRFTLEIDFLDTDNSQTPAATGHYNRGES